MSFQPHKPALLLFPAISCRNAPFEFYDPASPIYTSPRFLPPAKIEEDCQVEEAIISHGCTVKRSVIKNAVVGLRGHIEEGCLLEVGWGQCCLFFAMTEQLRKALPLLFKVVCRLALSCDGRCLCGFSCDKDWPLQLSLDFRCLIWVESSAVTHQATSSGILSQRPAGVCTTLGPTRQKANCEQVQVSG